MHPVLASPLVVLATALVPLVAQGRATVIPAALAAAPAQASTHYPFGLATPCRVQCLYDADETGFASPVAMRALAVRAEQAATNPTKGSIQLAIGLSTSIRGSANAASLFSSNRGFDHTVAFARRSVAMPATVPGFVGAFAPAFPLDQPFRYDPASGNLMVEFDVAAQPSGGWAVDATFQSLGVHANVGQACQGLAASSQGGGLGGTLVFTLSGGVTSAPAYLLLGFAELPVPIPVPGSSGCSVANRIDAVLPFHLDAGGAAFLALPLPQERLLRALPVFGQFLVWHPLAQRFETSQSRRVVLGDLYGVARVYDTTSNTTSSGTVQPNVATILRVDSE